VVAGAADDPVLDRGWPDENGARDRRGSPWRRRRIDHVDDAKLGCHSLVENRGCQCVRVIRAAEAARGVCQMPVAVSAGPPCRPNTAQSSSNDRPSCLVLRKSVSTRPMHATAGSDSDRMTSRRGPGARSEPLSHRRLEAACPGGGSPAENVAERPAEHAACRAGADLPTPGMRNAHSTRPMVQERDPDLEALAMLEMSTLASMSPGAEPTSVYSMRLIESPWSSAPKRRLGRESSLAAARRSGPDSARTRLPAHLRPARVALSRIGDAAAVRQPSQLPDGLLEAVAAPGRSERRHLASSQMRGRGTGRVGSPRYFV